MHDLTERFIAALEELHDTRDPDALSGLFSPDATLTKAGLPHQERGQDGARTFWENYRGVFDTVGVKYRHVVCGEGVAVLEWTSQGQLSDGKEFTYDGVSVLEAQDDSIDAFRTYYDTAAFLGEKTKL